MPERYKMFILGLERTAFATKGTSRANEQHRAKLLEKGWILEPEISLNLLNDKVFLAYSSPTCVRTFPLLQYKRGNHDLPSRTCAHTHSSLVKDPILYPYPFLFPILD